MIKITIFKTYIISFLDTLAEIKLKISDMKKVLLTSVIILIGFASIQAQDNLCHAFKFSKIQTFSATSLALLGTEYGNMEIEFNLVKDRIIFSKNDVVEMIFYNIKYDKEGFEETGDHLYMCEGLSNATGKYGIISNRAYTNIKIMDKKTTILLK